MVTLEQRNSEEATFTKGSKLPSSFLDLCPPLSLMSSHGRCIGSSLTSTLSSVAKTAQPECQCEERGLSQSDRHSLHTLPVL